MDSEKKNILKIFGLTILILFIFTNISAYAQEYASVIKDGVNIRSGPSTKNEVLWEVFKGFPVEILKREGDWAQIKDFENDKGWIYSSLLSSKKTVIVKGETVNLRSGPGKDNKIIATVKKGVGCCQSYLLKRTGNLTTFPALLLNRR